MVTPGLLPEADDRRPSPLRVLPWLLVAALAVTLVWTIRDRERVIVKTERVVAATASDQKTQQDRVRELEDQLRELRKSPPPPPPPAAEPAPPRAPDVRILPPERAAERITQGLHEFRSGRYAPAEACFLRAIPEGFLYVALCCVARGDVAEAVLFLERAMRGDPQWLRRVRPRDLFGSAEDYERMLGALEERVKADPLDHEAKTLLAYLHYHEKGAEHAKALLTEVAAARPDDPAPRAFLEALDKP